MAYETEAEREVRQKAERAAEVADHKTHLESPFLEKSKNYSDPYVVTRISPPEIPASPSAQHIVDALLALGFVTQAES